MTDFRFDPDTAASVASASKGLTVGIAKLAKNIANLRAAGGCGTFPSGLKIQKDLAQLGTTANEMGNRLASAIDEYEQTVIDAGGLITQQEAENRRNISQAGEGSGSSSDQALGDLILPKPQAPVAIPNGPNPLDQQQAAIAPGLLGIPCVSGDTAGKFACTAAPEAAGGLTLDMCVANLTSAQAAKLTMLAQQWQQLGADLTSAITTFHSIVQMKMNAGQWTGTSGPAVAASANKLVTTTVQISAQASANGAAIVAWAGALGDTKTYIDSLNDSRTAAIAAAPPESRATVQNQIDAMARIKMDSTYNPGVTAIAGGLSNLTDPSSPVAGVPLVLNKSNGANSSGAANSPLAATPRSTGGSGGSTSGPSGGSTAAANKSGSDAAQTLARQGSGDAAKPAAAQSGQANPASAAQNAMSKAGDTVKGLGGKGSDPAITRSAGLGSLTDAEKAAEKSAAGLGKGGGGGGAGGGGLGKLGGAGIAAAEGSLSARSSAGISAAERAMAAPQAGPATSRAMSPGGAPMGGARGAHAGGNDEGKEHKSARYLVSSENGEEIAGDLPDVAPPVLGGLNLDTSDNPETPTRR